MPHLLYSEAELDHLYPRFEAPDDERLDDLQRDTDDHVYQHGLGIAAAIRVETETQGRRRRPEAGTAWDAGANPGGPDSQEESGGGENGENRDGERRQGGQRGPRAVQRHGPEDAQLVRSPQESTSSSSLGRRRSARMRPPPGYQSGYHKAVRSPGPNSRRSK